MIALVTALAGITEGGLSAIGVREYALRSGEGRKDLMADVLGVRVLLTAAGVLVALAFTAAAGYDEAVLAGVAVYGVGFVLFQAQTILAVPLQATLRLGWTSGVELLRQVVMAAATVVVVLLGGGLVALLATAIPAGLVALAAAVVVGRGLGLARPRLDRAATLDLLRTILPYSAAAVFGVLYLRVITILVSLLGTKEEAGYYGAAYRVIEALIAIAPLVISSALPILARAGRDQRARLQYAFERLLTTAMALGVGLSLALFVGSDTAIEVIGGSELAPAADALRIQSIALLATFPVFTFGYGLIALDHRREVVLASGIACVAGVSSAVVLIPALGAEGGALALVAAEATLAAAYGLFLRRRETDLRVGTWPVVRVLAAGLLAGAVALLSGLPDVPAVALALVLYGVGLLAVGGIPPELRAALRPSAWRPRHE